MVSIWIEDASGQDVRRLVASAPRRGRAVFLWNGTDRAGGVVDDGFLRSVLGVADVAAAVAQPRRVVSAAP